MLESNWPTTKECEDIRRLLAAAEAVCAKACLTGRPGEDGYSYQVGRDGSEELQALADMLTEMKERYALASSAAPDSE